MKLEILICTVESHLDRVADILLPLQVDVCYLVSCQYLDVEPIVPASLAMREDVRVVMLKGRGVSNNRNHAFRHAESDILLLADDDGEFYEEGLSQILRAYEEHPDVDIALFKVDGMSKYYPENEFRFVAKDFRGPYCTASVEMTVRRKSLSSLQFNEHFGLGSEYLSAGEEQVFLFDALSQGLHIHWFPVTIGRTPPGTTGERFLSDVRVQRSKGATFCYLFGMPNALMLCLKESLHYLVYNMVNPFRLFYNMYCGIRYANHLKS